MPPWGIVAITLGVAAIELAVVMGIIVPALVRGSWGTLERRFPPRAPAPDAVRREFQSFSFGMLNLGSSVHVAVDGECLHLFPAWLARRLGCGPMSVPWEAIRPLGPGAFRTSKAMIGATRVTGPAWCLELAVGEPRG
jgi:hypothetical protein